MFCLKKQPAGIPTVPIIVALNHVTHYKYDQPVDIGPQIIRLRPAPHARARVSSYSPKVSPEKHFINWQQDPQGNWLARFVFPEKAAELKIEVDLVAEMAVVNPFGLASLNPMHETISLHLLARSCRRTCFLITRPRLRGPALAAYLSNIPRSAERTVDFLVELNAKLREKVNYTIRMEPGIQSPDETLQLGSGSCRDSAWLLIQILRHLGIAARFVSGYLIQLRPDADPLEGPREVESDFTDLHAWAEAYLPGAGWIGFDVTSGMMTGEGHISHSPRHLITGQQRRSAAPSASAKTGF